MVTGSGKLREAARWAERALSRRALGAIRGTKALVTIAMVALVATLAAVSYSFDVLLGLRVNRLVAHHSPRASFDEFFGHAEETTQGRVVCREGWGCEECNSLERIIQPSDTVSLYMRHLAFYVVFDRAG